MTYQELISLLNDAAHAYYNTSTPIMTDEEYDSIRDYLEENLPNYKNVIGAEVSKKKIKLPYYMPSLDKIKDDKLLNSWLKTYTGDVLISDKLDGNSAMFIGSSMNLYTRGNGDEGQDITHLIPYLKNKLTKNNYVIRGELISDVYNRNIVAGMMNSKSIDKDIAKTVSFIGYQIISPIMTPYEQFNIMKNIVPVVYHKYAKTTDLSKDSLNSYFIERKELNELSIDGIVVTHNLVYPINDTLKNPKHSFAFKTSEGAEIVTTTVQEVIWNVSKDGILIPVVHFNPITIDNIIIKRASGYNAKYIVDNGIGKGAIIIVERSGTVIPKIIKIITKSDTPDMPTIGYTWDDTKTHILVDEVNTNDVKFANLVYFFDKMDVENVSKGNLKKIYDAGYDNIGDIIHISIDNLLKIDGFKEKMAQKIHKSLNSIDMNPYKIMDASNVMGRGVGYEKIKAICDKYPNIILNNYIPTINELLSVNSIGNKTAELFIKNLPLFHDFVENNNLKFNDQQETNNNINQVIVFSQFRDSELEKKIKNNGGIVKDTITKQTTLLVVKDITKENSKIKAARSMNIPIISFEQFKNEYY